jgi:hypothetical protein
MRNMMLSVWLLMYRDDLIAGLVVGTAILLLFMLVGILIVII